ncbi:unnamed protein product [Kuraishia capsulata CBS 1993]|uniref:Exonuclease V, mitochondrial n=1 Tax=Kuraishia capsulata CBS 1993 TaxID=1382522 RepID=W6MFS4_9ASCO|nr:uncharacterized protein KUCA_T00000720001 [Kuraishia capsulata CBS 1993]CDK24754.1 unnamed protein product [Kuraishia capsulata CBS 1993]
MRVFTYEPTTSTPPGLAFRQQTQNGALENMMMKRYIYQVSGLRPLSRAISGEACKANTKTLRMRIPRPVSRYTENEPATNSQNVPVESVDQEKVIVKPFNENFAFQTELLQVTPSKTVPVQESQPALAPAISSKYLPTDQSNLLPYENFPDGLDTPINVYNSIRRPSGPYVQENRLSVTSLLTERWCELKEFYRDFVIGKEERPTEAMKRGSEEHEKLELTSHTVSVHDLELGEEDKATTVTTDKDGVRRLNLKLDDTTDVPLIKLPEKLEHIENDDAALQEKYLESKNLLLKYLSKDRLNEFEKRAFEWNKNISRLCSLLKYGESREILVHGMIRPSTLAFLGFKDVPYASDESEFDKDILVSGIIDHLVLESALTNGISEYQKTLTRKLLRDIDDKPVQNDRGAFDMNRFIAAVQSTTAEDGWNNSNLARPRLRIVVKDIKTRRWKNLPRQDRVRRSSKYQVMYYRKFLGLLSGEFASNRYAPQEQETNPGEFGYLMMLANAKKRGFDVDQPIRPELALVLSLNNQYLEQDLLRLQKGQSLGFMPYDAHGGDQSVGYSLSGLSMMVQNYNNQTTSQLDSLILERVDSGLFTEWKRPLTLRTLAARMAQLYSLLQPLLSERCAVEYVANGSPFVQLKFDYDENALNKTTVSSMQYWLGLRPPKPVSKNETKIYCSYCDFRPNCKWYLDQQPTN